MANNPIQTMLNQVNPSIDTTDPIIQDLVVKFASNVWEDVNTRVLQIQNKFNSSLLQNMTDTELNTFAYSTRGMVRNPGTYATGYVFVMTTQSGTDIRIPSGTLFSTSDGSWQFVSVIDAYIAAQDIPNYYNPARSMYEFRIPIRAIAPGTSYRVSSYRITSLRSPLSFTAMVENREPTSGGSDQETRTDFIQRIQSASAGFNVNSEESIRQAILQQIPDITDVSFYKPHPEANLVKVYYIGTVPTEDVITFTILPDLKTRFSFPVDKAPIRLITNVIYDGSIIDSSNYAYSKWEVAFNLPTPEAGKVVYCNVQYNALSGSLQDFFFGQVDIHQTKWVPEEAASVSFPIKVAVKIPSYLMGDEITDLVIDTILENVNTGTFVPSISSEFLVSQMKKASQNILDAQVSLNGNLPYISFENNQYPQLQRTDIDVRVI